MALIAHRFTIDYNTTTLVGQEFIFSSSNNNIIVPYIIETTTSVIPEIAKTFGISKPIFRDVFFDLGLKLGYLMKNSATKNNGKDNDERFQISTNYLCYERLMWREVANLNFGFYFPF